MSKNEEPAIVVGKAYDLVLWLIKKVERFARSYRFSVGDRLVGQSIVERQNGLEPLSEWRSLRLGVLARD